MDINYVREVASLVSKKYREDYEFAINVAESIHLNGDPDEDASRVYAIMQGEI